MNAVVLAVLLGLVNVCHAGRGPAAPPPGRTPPEAGVPSGQGVPVTHDAGRPTAPGTLPAWMASSRRILPDRSQGLGGLIGPFHWDRAFDLGAHVRSCDAPGVPKADGDHLRPYQFRRGARKNPETPPLHERNNRTRRDPSIAYERRRP